MSRSISPFGDMGKMGILVDTDIPRDKEATQQRILLAAAAILANQGLSELGVNALARAASCDKKLIYRYFNGLNGVILALGNSIAQRFVAELDHAFAATANNWQNFELALLQGLMSAYRKDPLLARLRAAEFASQDGEFAPLAQTRSTILTAWIEKHRPIAPPPKDVDVPAFNAAMIGAVETAVLSAAVSGNLAGLPLWSDKDWDRYHLCLQNMVMLQFHDAD